MVKKALYNTLGLALIAAGFFYFLHLYYRSQIFSPSDRRADPAKAPFDIEEVSIETADAIALNAWYRDAEPGAPTILYLHGNASNVDGYIRGFGPLIEDGYGVLAPDYRGYGGNPGRPTDEGLIEDGRAALGFLQKRGVRNDMIVLYGYSLGTGVAVPLAAESDVAAVILAAPFASIAEMGYRRFPDWLVDLLLADRFDSLAAIGNVREPVLILHGADDRTVPPRQSWLLARAGGRNVRRIVFADATHGWDLFEPRGHHEIRAFLGEIFSHDPRSVTAAD